VLAGALRAPGARHGIAILDGAQFAADPARHLRDAMVALGLGPAGGGTA
jgi:hypothetical protein